MKIDFHLHSIVSRYNGDSIKMISFLDNLKILKNYKVLAASFTDHNRFESKTYIEIRELAKKVGIKVYPGVELDVQRVSDISNIGNVLLIFSDELSDEALAKLESTINNMTGKRKLNIKDVDSLFSDFEKISVPHVGKSDFCDYEDLKYLDFDAIEISSEVHPNYKKFIKHHEGPYSVVAFSDTHVWTGYPQVRKFYTKLECENTFKDIKRELSKHKDFTRRY